MSGLPGMSTPPILEDLNGEKISFIFEKNIAFFTAGGRSFPIRSFDLAAFLGMSSDYITERLADE